MNYELGKRCIYKFMILFLITNTYYLVATGLKILNPIQK